MGNAILGRMDEMGTRMDELEESIAALTTRRIQHRARVRHLRLRYKRLQLVFCELKDSLFVQRMEHHTLLHTLPNTN